MADVNIRQYTTPEKVVTTLPRQTITIGAAATTGSFTIAGNGRAHTIVVEIADWTNDVTLTATIQNNSGDTIWEEAALIKNDTHVFVGLPNDVYFNGVSTFGVELSGVPGGTGGDVEVEIAII